MEYYLNGKTEFTISEIYLLSNFHVLFKKITINEIQNILDKQNVKFLKNNKKKICEKLTKEQAQAIKNYIATIIRGQ